MKELAWRKAREEVRLAGKSQKYAVRSQWFVWGSFWIIRHQHVNKQSVIMQINFRKKGELGIDNWVSETVAQGVIVILIGVTQNSSLGARGCHDPPSWKNMIYLPSLSCKHNYQCRSINVVSFYLAGCWSVWPTTLHFGVLFKSLLRKNVV